MELYGFMEREKKIPSYFFIITKVKKRLVRIVDTRLLDCFFIMMSSFIFTLVYLELPH